MTRLYRVLLRLYPASFLEAYGEQMCAVFEERLAASPGVTGRLGLLVAAASDVVPNALGAHAEILGQDVRFAARTLARSPAFAVTAVLVVAFGVGANTAAFSLADLVLLRPLPFPEPDRLVRIWQSTPGYGQMELSAANYRDWKAMSTSFERMGAFHPSAVNLVGSGEPQRLTSATISADALAALGVEPLRGRLFAADDSGTVDDRSVLLGYGLWQTELGGDPSVLGTAVNLDTVPHEIVGVMPESFRFPWRETRLWIPLRLTEERFRDRNDNDLEVVGRLAEGVTLAQARADLDRVAARLAQEYPAANEGTGANAYLLKDHLDPRARLLLEALGGAALCILLLACANLTNLLLARGASREREVAVRAALGAGRERLVRQMVTESALLAAAGGAVGVLLAVGSPPLLTRLVPNTLPIQAHPELDLRVLTLALAFTALTGVGFGMLPSMRVGGRRGFGALRDGGRGGGGRRQRLRAVLVSVQVASSVALLVSAGLLTRAMWRLQSVDPGFGTERVLTLRTPVPLSRYLETESRNRFYDRVLSEIRALPGVSGAAYTSGLPMVLTGGIWPVVIEGDEVVRSRSNSASLRFVTPGFSPIRGRWAGSARSSSPSLARRRTCRRRGPAGWRRRRRSPPTDAGRTPASQPALASSTAARSAGVSPAATSATSRWYTRSAASCPMASASPAASAATSSAVSSPSFLMRRFWSSRRRTV